MVAITAISAAGLMACSITLPYLTGRVIDDSLTAGDRGALAPLVAAVLVICAIRFALGVVRRWVSGKVSLAVEFDIRSRFFAHLQRQSLAYFDRMSVGQLMSRATSDLQTVRFFLGYGLIFVFMQAFTLVIVTGILLWMNVGLALVALLMGPALLAVAWRYSRRSNPVLIDVQQRVAEVTEMAEESAVGIRVIKAFGQEGERSDRFGATARHAFDRSMDAAHLRALYEPLMGFLPILGLGVILVYGGLLTIDGSLTLGEFVAFYLYLTLLIAPFRSLGMLVSQAQRAVAGGTRIFEVLDSEPRIVPPDSPTPLPAGGGNIRFEAVSFRYAPGAPDVLCEIDLDIPAGRTIALIGPTGSGKSTLTQLVPRFYDATAGRVLVDGADVRDLDLVELRRTIGMVSQDPFLFSTTVRENIAYGRPAATDEEVRRGRAHGPGRGLHRRAARRVRHGHRRARPDALGRPAPAPRHRAGDHHRPAHPDPRRGHRLGGRLHRARDPGGPGGRDGGAHHPGDRPPALDRRPRRRAGRARGRPGGRPRPPRGAVRVERPVPGDPRRRAGAPRPDRGGRMSTTAPRVGMRDLAPPPVERHKLRRLLPYFRPYTGRAVTTVVLMLIVTACGLAVPALAQFAIDHGITAGDRGVLVLSVVAFVAIGLVGWLAGYYQTYMSSWVGERVLLDLRTDTFRHLMRLELGYHERTPTGRTVSRLTSDIEALDQLVTDGVTSLVVNGLTFLGVVAILFSYDAELALLTFVIFPPLAIATALFRVYSTRAYRLTRERIAEVLASLQETLSGIRVVQGFGREEPTKALFRGRQHRVPRGQHVHDPAVGHLLPGRRVPGRASGTAIILYFGSTRVLDQDMSDRRDGGVHRLPVELLRPHPAAVAAVQHVPVGHGRAGEDLRGAGHASRAHRRARRRAAAAHPAATSSCATSASATRPPRSCGTSTCTSRRARPWPSWAPPARASPRSPS